MLLERTAVPRLTVYTTSWCGPCRRLKDQLTRGGISFHEVDIETTPDAEAFIRGLNGGNATVPTVVLADGSALTDPTLSELLARLEATA